MKWSLALLLAIACASFAPCAAAQASDSDRATARALAEEGNKALAAKDYALAEDRFRRADALIRAPSLMVDHARALVGLGRFAEAYATYDAARKEKLAKDAPAAFRRAVKEAERGVKELEPKIAWVTIRVSGPSEPLVKLGEREVPPSALGTAIPADIGSRTVQVSAEGYVSKEAPLSLVAGQRAEVELELEPAHTEPPPAPPPPVVKHVVHQQAPQPEPRSNTLAYIALGVGGAGLAIGAVTGVLYFGERSSLESACANGQCQPAYYDDVDRMHVYSYTSAISLGVGVVAAGTGIVLLLTKPKDPEQQKAAHVTPYVSLGSVGVEGAF